jgi:hypothetical protein
MSRVRDDRDKHCYVIVTTITSVRDDETKQLENRDKRYEDKGIEDR